MNGEQRQTAADPWTKPTDLSHWPAFIRQLSNYIHHRHHCYSARKPIMWGGKKFKFWELRYEKRGNQMKGLCHYLNDENIDQRRSRYLSQQLLLWLCAIKGIWIYTSAHFSSSAWALVDCTYHTHAVKAGCVHLYRVAGNTAVAVLGKNIWGAWPLIIWEATTAKRNYYRSNYWCIAKI